MVSDMLHYSVQKYVERLRLGSRRRFVQAFHRERQYSRLQREHLMIKFSQRLSPRSADRRPILYVCRVHFIASR